MKLFLTIITLLIFSLSASAQSIKITGQVKDEAGKSVNDATVILFHEGSADSIRAVTNDKGIFIFQNVTPAKTGILVSHSGYNVFAQYYDYSQSTQDQVITDINMVQGSKTLEGIVVMANKITIKEDTVSYRIDSTMFRKNDNVEELLKKLPGVEVDNKTGAVTAQGQSVTKVKVNGKDFFGGDVSTATKNLNADMVDRIDIIDDYGDQSAFTGIKTGDASKTLNIQLKKDKNRGWFGNADLGAGTDGRYKNSVTINRFNNERQISLVGNLNNTNTSTFNFGSMGGMMGGMMRSMSGAFGGSGDVGAGIANTKSIGLNYRDQWGPKVSSYGSYSFTNKGVNTNTNIHQQNLLGSSSITNDQDNKNYTLSNTHRANFNIEYKINPNNYLKISPNFSYQESQSNYLSTFAYRSKANTLLSNGTTKDITNSSSPNLSGNLLYNHRFTAKGRIISLNASAGASGNNGNDIYNNKAIYYDTTGNAKDSLLRRFIQQNNDNNNYSAALSYIEPFTKQKSLEFNYSYRHQYTAIDRENYKIDSLEKKDFLSSGSTNYDNIYNTNKFGVNYRNNQKKFNYTIGFAVQPATIIGNTKTTNTTYRQNIINFFPVLRYAYNFSRSKSLNLSYNGSSSQPSYTQLQPIADSSNLQNIIVGNPFLKPEFSNRINLRFNKFNFITGDVFFGNLSFSTTSDKIVNNVFATGFGSQKTTYLNTNGFYTGSAFYAFSKPFKNRKYVFNYGGNVIYNNNISFLANEKNVGKNFILTQRLNTIITIKKWLETGGGVTYTYNDTRYSLRKAFNNKINTVGLTQNSRFFLPKDFTITYDIDKTINNGYGGAVNTNPTIINASMEKLVSKKYNASIKLSGFDLLKENTNINRSVTGNSITDTRTNNLTRYFLLSAVFRFSKFVGQAPARMRFGGPPPPPPAG